MKHHMILRKNAKHPQCDYCGAIQFPDQLFNPDGCSKPENPFKEMNEILDAFSPPTSPGLPASNEKVAIKYDDEKIQLGLISTPFLNGLGKVLTFGAKKYAAHNWRNGFKASRLYDALQRHLVAWNSGVDLDEESGLPHLGHAAACLMFLYEQMETKPELDDRYKIQK
jgi:hypothetical protein